MSPTSTPTLPSNMSHRRRPSDRCSHVPSRSTRAGVLLLVGGLLLAACSSAGSAVRDEGHRGRERTTLRLGYFPNITHAPALVGIRSGRFAAAIAPEAKLEPVAFNAGPAAVEALFAGDVDAAFIGPSPAINAFAKSGGQAVRIVSGATSGGAFLVVRPTIHGLSDLKRARLATPQIGGTQDVALRAWLRTQGLRADVHGGGDVSVLPQDNSRTLDAFLQGRVDGAWVPEPWATRLVQQGGAKVLVDERALWTAGRWATTLLVVRTAVLREHPATVRALLGGLVATIDSLASDPTAAQAAANDQIEAVTGKRIKDDVLRTSWKNLEFTVDPIPSSLDTMASEAHDVGLLDHVGIHGIFDLRLLDDVLVAAGRDPVVSP